MAEREQVERLRHGGFRSVVLNIFGSDALSNNQLTSCLLPTIEPPPHNPASLPPSHSLYWRLRENKTHVPG